MAARTERTEKAPESPPKLDRRGWLDAIKRTGKEFSDDNLTDWAAALTYYGVLSIFPALIAVVSILGLIGGSVTHGLLTNLGGFAPGPARAIMTNAIEGLQHSRGGAGILFVVGIVGAIWSASGYIAGFMRASNAIWDAPEGRPIWKTLPLRVGVTVLMLVLLTVSAVAVVFTGPLADRVGKLIGLSSAFVTAWDIAKWPVLVVIIALMFSILYYVAPNVRQPGFKWVTPGGVVAVLIWMAASALFALYVGNFGSYNKTYGTLGGVISFLVWLWISNLAILFGAELNAELERGRQIEAGEPADREPYLPLRDEPKKT